jgi:glycosyltransferase involved in cell wall biosynthesis
MKPKVLCVIDTLEVGGAETSLLEILKRAEKIEPLVCSIYAGGKLKAAFEDAQIPTVSFDLKGKYRYWTATRRILALIHKERPHLIHTTLARSHFVGRTAGRLSGTPVVSSFVNDSYSARRYERLNLIVRLKLRVTQLLDRITARWAFHFIANSQTIKSSMQQSLGIPEGKVSVIYRGRDPSLQSNHDPSLRQALSLREDVPIILNVGRLILQKAQKDLIRAIAQVRNEHPVRLLIAGEGPYRPNLTALIQDLQLSETISLLGQRNDVPSLLHLADVFVFPSYYEGHPGALVEAMFAGCPIIASDISVHRETIRHQETGLLVPVEQSQAIAEAILWMLRHPEESHRMGKRAREVASHRFHINHVVNQYEQLCMEVLNRWRNMQGLNSLHQEIV